jgi:hypothetical protein
LFHFQKDMTTTIAPWPRRPLGSKTGHYPASSAGRAHQDRDGLRRGRHGRDLGRDVLGRARDENLPPEEAIADLTAAGVSSSGSSNRRDERDDWSEIAMS